MIMDRWISENNVISQKKGGLLFRRQPPAKLGAGAFLVPPPTIRFSFMTKFNRLKALLCHKCPSESVSFWVFKGRMQFWRQLAPDYSAAVRLYRD